MIFQVRSVIALLAVVLSFASSLPCFGTLTVGTGLDGAALPPPPAREHEAFRHVGPQRLDADGPQRPDAAGLLPRAAEGSRAPSALAEATDLDVTHIERTPRYDYDAAKNNPAPGDVVTFHAHVRSWGSSPLAAVGYRWQIDGATVATGTLTNLSPGEERVVTRDWTWLAGDHWVQFTADPANAIAESSEANNEIEDRINAIIAGFWVEQSAFDYFHQYQRDLGIGSNSWQDWIQRQMRRQNQLYVAAIWPNAPAGVLDRVRIDKIVVVPDGALPLHGGVATNHPDLSDRTVDLMWGFPANQIPPYSSFYADHTTVSESNPFYVEQSLIHELGHARYLIDSYGFDVHNTAHHGGYDSVQIWEGSTYVAGSTYMPYLAWDEVLHYNTSGGVMSGPYGFQWSPYEAGALNLIAGQRATCGNYNAPCNIGVYLQNLPERNHIRLVDESGAPRALASLRVYRATSGPGWYGKTFDNSYDAEYVTGADGYAHLPRNPFTGGPPLGHSYGIANGIMILRVEHAGQVWYRFVEAADFNMQYWAGNTQDAWYTITLPGPNGGEPVAISGTVSDPPGVNPGVVLYPEPRVGTSGPVETDANGAYVLTVANGWSGTVRPVKSGYRFHPPLRQYAAVSADLVAENYAGELGAAGTWTLTTVATLPAPGGQAVSLGVANGALHYLAGWGQDDGVVRVGNGFWRWQGPNSFVPLPGPPLEPQTQDDAILQSDLYVSMGAALLAPDGQGLFMVAHAADNEDFFGGNRDVLRYNAAVDSWTVWDNAVENTGANGVALVGSALYVNWQGWDPVSRFDVSGFPSTVVPRHRVTTPGNNLWPGALVRGAGNTVWGTHPSSPLPATIELYSFDGALADPVSVPAPNGALPAAWGTLHDGQPLGGIEYVPAEATRSGHDEVWVLRGSSSADLAVYDTVSRGWKSVSLEDVAGNPVPFQASDMCFVDGKVYFVTAGGDKLWSITPRSLPAVAPGEVPTLSVARGTGDTLVLTWNTDCGSGARFAVYRGNLGTGPGSESAENCDVAETSLTVPVGPRAADFFLVAPHDGEIEGSLGVRSDGTRRPAPPAACHPLDTVDACAP